MSDIKQIPGVVFTDYRGHLTHFNEFDFKGVSRYYVIHHDNTQVIRGWHGHQFEKKWFQCLKGSFVLSFVRPDDWENPSSDLVPQTFHLNAQNPTLLCLPEGYANCIRATTPDSILMVYSGKPLAEANLDSWRWEADMWGGDKI
ncbi:MAG: WxcM-like domain-containing protein [Rikenellaceae bacterium]